MLASHAAELAQYQFSLYTAAINFYHLRLNIKLAVRIMHVLNKSSTIHKKYKLARIHFSLT